MTEINVFFNNTDVVAFWNSQGCVFQPENDHILEEKVMKIGSCGDSAAGTFTPKHVSLRIFMGFIPPISKIYCSLRIYATIKSCGELNVLIFILCDLLVRKFIIILFINNIGAYRNTPLQLGFDYLFFKYLVFMNASRAGGKATLLV